MQMRQKVVLAQHSPFWATINFSFFIIFLTDLYVCYCFIATVVVIFYFLFSSQYAFVCKCLNFPVVEGVLAFLGTYLIIFYSLIRNFVTEFVLMIIFLVNFGYNALLCVWIKKTIQPIELTAEEFALFGISHKEIGFKLKKENAKDTKVDDTLAKKSISYPASPPFELNTSSIMDKHSSLDSTVMSSRLFDSSLDTTSASWSYIRPDSGMWTK